MIIDAIVLAGGRATRLGGTSKAALSLAGGSLLETTLASLTFARRIVVIGDETEILAAAPDAAARHEGLMMVRESPAFAGPAAAIAAGVGVLSGASLAAERSTHTVVVGCDMPGVGHAIDTLLAAVRATAEGNDGESDDGAVALSTDGRPQQLVGVYSSPRLADCVARHREADDLENLSVRALLAGLDPVPVPVPPGSTDDVDTWSDAARLGVLTPQPKQPKGPTMADVSPAPDQDAILRTWCTHLLAQLQLGGVEVDVDAVLALAGQVAHAVVRPAAPLTTFVVGYAAGLAVGTAGSTQQPVATAVAFDAAASTALAAARDFDAAS